MHPFPVRGSLTTDVTPGPQTGVAQPGRARRLLTTSAEYRQALPDQLSDEEPPRLCLPKA